MEEILASIRRIIADDQGEPATPAEAAEAAEAADASLNDAVIGAIEPDAEPFAATLADDADDVLDLDDEVASTPAAPLPVTAAAGVVANEGRATPPPRLVDEAPPVSPPRATPGPAPREPAPAPLSGDGRLVSPHTGAAVGGAFNALASTILSQNARTLEDLVEDMMRPMLKEWLDDNLPTIVERLVRTEIERVARGGR